MSGERCDIADLYALQYPAAERAARTHGTRYRYRQGDALSLDWDPILVGAARRGLRAPRPELGRTSFWYVAWNFAHDRGEVRAVLSRIIGGDK
jgi:hypothetical protein